MRLKITITASLSEGQKERLLSYYHYADVKERRIHNFNAPGNTNKGSFYEGIEFEIDKEIWDSRGSDLSDIFKEGNYTIEDVAS